MKRTTSTNLLIKSFLVFNFLLLLSSCRHNNQKPFSSYQVKVVESKGYVIPQDSMAEPRVIPVDNSKLKRIPAGKSKIVLTNTNIHAAGKPKVVLAGTPRVNVPGTGAYSLPETVPAIENPFVAGVPEVVIAKDMANKDQNPENFSYFGKLQGLKHMTITCMIEDKSGNLWFGTYGGGVSKYDGKSFSHFTEKEGLSDNVVYSISEDLAGNLWFGTWRGGVSRYDGNRFTHFTEKEGLGNNSVFSILKDKYGNLWFGTEGGVSKYDGKSFSHLTEKEGLGNNSVSSILEDKSGNLWFGTNGGVSKYDGKSFMVFTDKEGLGNNEVRCILEDKSGNLWFGTNGGVSKYDGKRITHFTVKEGLSNNRIQGILEDESGNLWFGTEGGGISKYNGKNFITFTDKEGLSNNYVSGILEDRSGNLWFATNGGVSKYNGKCFTIFPDEERLSNNVVESILEDRSGNLWFGTDGGGVSKYDGKSLTHFTEKEGLSNNIIWSILEDRSGNLWFGTEGGGVSKYDGRNFTHFTEKDGLGNNVVLSILEDRSGNLWFGTYGSGVSKYDGKSFTHFTVKEGLSNNIVWSILEDRSGNLWFGTWGGGVTKYDGKRFTHFTGKEGLSNNIVWNILEDKSGNLWFGTYGGGVSEYDGKKFTYFTEKEGLNNNVVYSILEDKSGNLWFGTRFGLSKLTREKMKVFSGKVRSDSVQKGDVFFKNYTYADGFLGIGCNHNAILESKTGTIWIGANDRLTAFHPEVQLTDSIAPNIQVTAIELFNENIDWANLEQKKDTSFLLGNGVRVGNFKFDGISRWYSLPEGLSLAYNNNYLTFNFIGITQNQPGKVKYQYKLEDIDENWSAITNRNSATYGNLPHGSYSFKVKAMNSEGHWSPEFSYTFTIRPPWWKTWWMYAIYGLIFIGSVSFIVWWNGRRLRERAKKLELEVDKATIVIKEQKEAVEAEKRKSDELLLNILPFEVAEELKQTGHYLSKSHKMVTVMFADFKEFSIIGEKISAEFLVDELNYCFSAFDNILQDRKIEKIKTIGDAYMCASGVPVYNHAHAFDLVNAAIEIRNFMLTRKQEKESRGEIPFELRIGIHTGPVVAGIVGVKKFQYDIWGDTVNLAARMESSGEPGKVNISGTTYALVKDQFSCTYRGKVKAKNKGEIDMYFVERISQ